MPLLGWGFGLGPRCGLISGQVKGKVPGRLVLDVEGQDQAVEMNGRQWNTHIYTQPQTSYYVAETKQKKNNINQTNSASLYLFKIMFLYLSNLFMLGHS